MDESHRHNIEKKKMLKSIFFVILLFKNRQNKSEDSGYHWGFV